MTASTAVPSRHRLAGAAATLAGLLALAALALTGSAAWAHGATGTMAVTTAEQAGPLTVRLEVGVKYENDDDLAEEAKVEATLTEADGTVVGPVALPQIRNALYGTQVQVPKAGTYAIAVTSTSPAATASGSVQVTGDPAGGGGSGSSTTTATGARAATSTTAAATTSTTAAPATTSASSSTPLIVGIVVVLVLVGAVGGFLAVRRKGS